MHVTAESLTPLWRAQRSHWHRCDVHSGVIDTAVTCTAESLTPLWRVQRSHWLRCVNMTPLWLLTSSLPGSGYFYREYLSKKTYIGQLSYTISITFIHKKWGLNSHWLRCDKNRRLQSRFSRRILIHIEKGFNLCPRGLGGVVWWKKPEVENLVSGSL
jgi:hypothetical protein